MPPELPGRLGSREIRGGGEEGKDWNAWQIMFPFRMLSIALTLAHNWTSCYDVM